MQVELLTLGQDMDLHTGIQVNRLTMRLPNGEVFAAHINAEAMSLIVQVKARERMEAGDTEWGQKEVGPTVPVVVSPTRGLHPPARTPAEYEARGDLGYPAPPGAFRKNADGEIEFGGDLSEQEALPPLPVHTPSTLKPVLVGKDDFGYPIMRMPDGSPVPDASEVTGGFNADDDGVGSL
jgi:hypothetical protein